jgi:hypothetical protein
MARAKIFVGNCPPGSSVTSAPANKQTEILRALMTRHQRQVPGLQIIVIAEADANKE